MRIQALVFAAIGIAGVTLAFAARPPVSVVIEWPKGVRQPSYQWKWGNGEPASFEINSHESLVTVHGLPREWKVEFETRELTEPRIRIKYAGERGTEAAVVMHPSPTETSTIWVVPGKTYETSGLEKFEISVRPSREP